MSHDASFSLGDEGGEDRAFVSQPIHEICLIGASERGFVDSTDRAGVFDILSAENYGDCRTHAGILTRRISDLPDAARRLTVQARNDISG
jgi:hypothetical protein